MLEIARRTLRDTIDRGDAPQVIDDKVARAAPGVGEERQAALWLYAFHLAGGGDARRRVRRPAGHGHRALG